MSYKKNIVLGIVLCCIFGIAAAAELTLKDGRVFRNYRIKEVAGSSVTIEYSGVDGEAVTTVAELSQLPPEIAFLYAANVSVAPAVRSTAAVGSGDAGSPVAMKGFVDQLKNISDRAGRLRAVDDIKIQLEQQISSRAVQDEFAVAWVDSEGLLLRVLSNNGTLKAGEYIFVKGARSYGNKLRLSVYPVGFRKKYGSFGSVKVFTSQSNEAAAEAVKFICHAAGVRELLEAEKNTPVRREVQNIRQTAAAPAPGADYEPQPLQSNPINQTYDYNSAFNKDDWRSRQRQRNSDYNNRRRNCEPVNADTKDLRQSAAKRAEELLTQAKNAKRPGEAVTNVNYNKAQLTSSGGVRESEKAAARQSYSDLRNSSVRANEAAAERQSYSNIRNVRESENVAERQSYSNVRNVRESESVAERQSYSNVRNVRANEAAAERQSYSNVRNVRESESVAERQSYSNVRNVRESEQVASSKKYSDVRNVRENERVAETPKYSDINKNRVVEEPKVKFVQEAQQKNFNQKKQTGKCRKICEEIKEAPPKKKTGSFSGGPIVKRDKRKIFSYDHLPDKFRKR